MNLRQIETFVLVAELGSFSKAAERLKVAQPALSRQVRALEVELRDALLVRNGRGVTATEAGKRLLAHGQDILHRVTAARDDLVSRRDEPVGHVVIGLPPSLARRLTLPLIEHFQAHLPKARLAVVEGFSMHITEWLIAGRVDLAMVYNPKPQPAIEIEPVLPEPLCLMGAAGSLQAGAAAGPAPSRRRGTTRARAARLPATIALKDVARHPLVMPQWDHTFRQLMEQQAVLAGIKLNVAWEVSSVPTILDLVRKGHGFATLTRSAILSEAGPDSLDVVPIGEPPIQSTLCLAWSAQQRRSPLNRRAGEVLVALCRAGEAH